MSPVADDLVQETLLRAWGPMGTNRRPEIRLYLDGNAHGIMVFALENGAIAEIVGFPDASLFCASDLPASLPPR